MMNTFTSTMIILLCWCIFSCTYLTVLILSLTLYRDIFTSKTCFVNHVVFWIVSHPSSCFLHLIFIQITPTCDFSLCGFSLCTRVKMKMKREGGRDQAWKSDTDLEPKVTSLPTFVPLVAANHTLCPSRSSKHRAAVVAGNPPIPVAEERGADASWSVNPEKIGNIAFTFGHTPRKSEDLRHTWWRR